MQRRAVDPSIAIESESRASLNGSLWRLFSEATSRVRAHARLSEAQVVDQVAGFQVVDQVAGAQVVDQVAGVHVMDQVAGVRVVVNQVAETQAIDHCWCAFHVDAIYRTHLGLSCLQIVHIYAVYDSS